jgi:hypothetical protein
MSSNPKDLFEKRYGKIEEGKIPAFEWLNNLIFFRDGYMLGYEDAKNDLVEERDRKMLSDFQRGE